MTKRFVTAQLALIGVALFALLSVLTARGDAIVSDCTEVALRDAIAEGGLVTFDSDCTFVLSDTIVITNTVTLEATGLDVVISGGNLARLFRVMAGGSLELNGLTLTSGKSTNGGAIYIEADGEVTGTDCIFVANRAVGADGTNGANGNNNSTGIGSNGGNGKNGGNGWGGAIYNLGDLTLLTCQFLTNSASGGKGGNGGNGGDGGFQGGNGGDGGDAGSGLGGAVYNAGTSFSLSDCTYETNAVSGGNGGLGGTNGVGPFLGLRGIGGAAGAGSGAAVFTLQDAAIANCTFSENVASGGNSAAGGTLSNGNGSNGPRGGDSAGGGLYNGGASSLTNCTFFKNSVKAGNGGDGGPGQFTGGNGGNGGNGTGGGLCNSNEVAVVNCTFASCGAVGGTNGAAGIGAFPGSKGSPGKGRGGNIAQGAGTFSLFNSIISTNTAGTNLAKLSGSFIDGGYNISSDSSYNFTGTSKTNTDPKIADLADNGGPTATMALKSGSPAIDAGNDAAAPETDQRGFLRPLGLKSDIGAFEQGFVIKGQVTLLGNGVPGVLITAGNQSTITDSNGNYVIDAYGSTVVTPSSSNFVFEPLSQTVNATANRSDVDFTAVELFTIAGRVIGASGTITVAMGTGGTNVMTADTNGNYSFSRLSPGTYLITPSAEGFQFDPSSVAVTVGPTTNTLNFFALFQISGRVTDGGNGLAGVTVAADTASAVTDATGAYTITGVRAGTYFVFATLAGYNFGSSQEVTVGPNATGVNFAVIQPLFTVSGRVTYGTAGLSGVRIFGAQTTDANGNFSLALRADTYTFTPSKSGYLFLPKSRTVTVTTNVTGVDFAAGALFTSIRLTNTGVLLVLAGPPGQTRIEASSNLTDWIDIFTNNPPFQFLDRDATNFSRRFYRSVQP
jgi:hypothetical protein